MIKPGQITTLRNQLGMSMPDFAELLNTDLRTIAKWESGTTRPGSTAKAVITALTHVLEAHNEADRKKIVKFIHDSSHIGGLSFLLLKLFTFLPSKSV